MNIQNQNHGENKQEFLYEGYPIAGNCIANNVHETKGVAHARGAQKTGVTAGRRNAQNALKGNALPKDGKLYHGLSHSGATIQPPNTMQTLKNVPPPATKFTANNPRKNAQGRYEEDENTVREKRDERADFIL